jgi:hypothetical protein
VKQDDGLRVGFWTRMMKWKRKLAWGVCPAYISDYEITRNQARESEGDEKKISSPKFHANTDFPEQAKPSSLITSEYCYRLRSTGRIAISGPSLV